jgi:alkylation response protein AidB-like acyl-CoA dehydrogenase
MWFLVDGDRLADLEVWPVSGVDLTRGLGRVTLRGLPVAPEHIVAVDATRVRAVAATLFAAEAVGLARWCLDTGLEYVKTREQFGRPVGSFQAIKHKCRVVGPYPPPPKAVPI